MVSVLSTLAQRFPKAMENLRTGRTLKVRVPLPPGLGLLTPKVHRREGEREERREGERERDRKGYKKEDEKERERPRNHSNQYFGLDVRV